jgi:hypothetical protein
MGLAYDSIRQRVVLFGGDGLPADCGTGGKCDDTFTWNGANQTWTKCDPLTQCATRPSARSSGEMAFHADRGTVIMFGGVETGNVQKDDTWAWNGTQWTQLTMLTHPPARNGQRMVYYPEKKYILMFGGNVMGGAPDNDTWTLDGGDWVQRFPSDSPSDRCCVGLAYFGGSQKKLFLFGGGILPSPVAVGDMWRWGITPQWTCISAPSTCQRNP